MQRSLFIFRRDLRLEDNTALLSALASSDSVIPCFIFDTRQVSNNSYKSDNLLQFMLGSLSELDNRLRMRNGRMYYFFGKTEEIVWDILSLGIVNAVYFNMDYTPFSLQRDKKIQAVCKKHKVDCHCFHDALLAAPGSVLKDDGKPYTVFTAFMRKARTLVAKLKPNSFRNYYRAKIKGEVDKKIFSKILPRANDQLLLSGGFKEAVHLIAKTKCYKPTLRDYPSVESTHFSAHNKLGTVSIRKVYWAMRDLGYDSVITELYWRDFFTHIAYHFPHVFSGCFHKKYDKLKWSTDKKTFAKWCEGKTGFPIVDAGMRELNTTGFMHNRVRMIVASFLVKDLHINWQWGEKYFATKLIDYDPCVNNGNWQWAASTGCDAQPYFRIFNPWRQQERFDFDCKYIKKWVLELLEIEPKVIHQLHRVRVDGYPQPMVDHSVEAKIALERFKNFS